MTPYYEHGGITIYHGDCAEILPTLGHFDLCLTDPPYGIKRANGMGGKGYDGFGKGAVRKPKQYAGGWDDAAPSAELLRLVADSADQAIIWGGNYFTEALPVGKKWLIWDKQQTMPSYSDAELAWTNLDGVALKLFRYCGAGLMAKEKNREHPTQKPEALFSWCLNQASTPKRVVDPFAGSGTSGRVCKDRGIECVMIELDEMFCEVSARRLQQEVLL